MTVKQHKHNWQWRITEWKGRVNDHPQSGYGFDGRRYWACIRGGEIKHTMKLYDKEVFKFYLKGEIEWPWNHIENVHIMASGNPFVPLSKIHEDEYVYR